MNHGYFIGIGSNIHPEHNIPLIVDRLAHRFRRLAISPCIHTHPVGISSHNDFINAVILIETREDKHQIKAFFNQVEAELGRDRSDADKKIKDRTADIDILWEIASGTTRLSEDAIPHEVYLHAAFIALARDLELLPTTLATAPLTTVELQLHGQSFGHATTTIDYDAAAGGVVIIQQAAYR